MTAEIPFVRPAWHCMTTQADVLGESPFWHPQEKCLYWVDIPGRRLRRMKVSSDLSQSHAVEDWPLQEEPGCFAPASKGGWVMALRSGIYRAREWGGALELLAVELPVDPGDAFREIKPATVAAEGSGNLAADVQNRAGNVMRTVGDVAEFAPSTAIDIVRGAEIPRV